MANISESSRNIWVCSDWHFGHQKEFLWKPRGFESVEEMNEAIIERHNSVVAEDDDVYMLGDAVLGDTFAGLRNVNRLNGRLHIILGNHDTDSRAWLYENECDNVVEVAQAKRLKYHKYHLFLSHYPCLCSNYDDGQPLRSRCISLCGHSHTTNAFADWDKGIIYHCEMDAHNCYPVNLDQVISEILERYNGKN